MNDQTLQHLLAMRHGRAISRVVDMGLTGSADLANWHPDDLLQLHASAETRTDFPALLDALHDVCWLVLSEADEDQFARIHYALTRRGLRCLAQLNNEPYYLFSRQRGQHLLFTATADNFHFAEPVIALAASTHTVTRLPRAALTPATLAGTLKYCDVAWFEWGDGAIVAASRMPKYCRIVCRIHRYELYRQEILQVNWRQVDEVIFVSQAMKQRFITALGDKLPATLVMSVIGNLSVVPPLMAPLPRKNPFHIACVARFIGLKNLPLLLLIMQALVQRDPRYRLFIAGRAEDPCVYESFVDQMQRLGLTRHIVIEGVIDAQNMAAWYADKSVVLSTSCYESQGMGILEAMLCGLKPVVFPATGGLTEYLPASVYFQTIDEAVAQIVAPPASPQQWIDSAQAILATERTAARYQQCWQLPDSQPLFSILIPTFNRAEMVLAAVCSALSQRDAHYEVLVVDDGSDDDTLARLAHAFDDPRLRVIAKAHTHAPDTRNAAIAAARGAYLVWLDSDDLLHPNALTHYRRTLARYPQVDVIGCALETFGADKKYFAQRHHAPRRWIHTLVDKNIVSNPACCVAASLYARAGGYDVRFLRAHDYEFWSRAMAHAEIAFIPACNVIYRLHEHSLTGIGKPVDRRYEYLAWQRLVTRYSLRQLFPDVSRRQAEAALAQKRQHLLQSCQLDNLLVVVDATDNDAPRLMRQLASLARQHDRRFSTLILSHPQLPLLNFPHLTATGVDRAAIARYRQQHYPTDYCRTVLMQAAAPVNEDAIALLKQSLIDDSVACPDGFTFLTT